LDVTNVSAAGLPGNQNPKRKVGGIRAASIAITDRQGDRLGSYRLSVDGWVAVGRRGQPLGTFESEIDAVDAIMSAAAAR
jgi:hypothetical protein